MVKNVGNVKDDKHRIDSHREPRTPSGRFELHQREEKSCEQDVTGYALQRILDRIKFLPDKIAQNRSYAVAGHTAPSAGHITEARNKENVDRN